MNVLARWALLAGLIAAFQLGCGDDDDGNGGTPTDKEQPTDTAPGESTDPTGTDTAEPGGTDTAGGGTQTLDALAVDADGNIVIGGTNNLINGSFYNYSDATSGGDSTIEVSVSTTGLGYCAKGTASQVLPKEGSSDLDYNKYWGAGFGFTLCNDPSGTGDLVIEECTAVDLSGLLGFNLKITGATIPAEIRVTMTERDAEGKDRQEGTYIQAGPSSADQSIDYLFKDAVVVYNTELPAVNPARIRALAFQVATNKDAPTPYEFCVEEIKPIIAAK